MEQTAAIMFCTFGLGKKAFVYRVSLFHFTLLLCVLYITTDK